MKWYEFTQDNGDGSYSKLRFKTKEEAQKSLEYLETLDWWIGDGDGINEVNTDSSWFFSSYEKLSTSY